MVSAWRSKSTELALERLGDKIEEVRSIAYNFSQNVNQNSQKIATGGKGSGSGGFGAASANQVFNPTRTPITSIDVLGVDTGVLDRINIQSRYMIVTGDDPTDLNVKFIQRAMGDGQPIWLMVESGKTLHLQTGGDIDIGAQIDISDTQIIELMFNEESDVTIDGGFTVIGLGSGGGGLNFPLLYPEDDLGNQSATTIILDLSGATGQFKQVTFTGDNGIGFLNPPGSTVLMEFWLLIIQDGVGGHSISSVAPSVKNGSSMDSLLDKTALAQTFFHFVTGDGGVTYHVELVDLTAGGVGANIQLSNLGTTAINSDLDPAVDGVRDLGNNLFAWDKLYASAFVFRNSEGVSPSIDTLGKEATGDIFLNLGNTIDNFNIYSNGILKFELEPALGSLTIFDSLFFESRGATASEFIRLGVVDTDKGGINSNLEIQQRIANVPKVVVSSSVQTMSVDINMQTLDMFNIDRLRFTADSGVPVTNDDPSIFLTTLSEMVFNVADQKQFMWTISNENKMILDEQGINNDTIFQIQSSQADINAVVKFVLFRDDPNPTDGAGIALMQFFGNEATVSGGASIGTHQYAEISSEYEDVVNNQNAGNLLFSVSRNLGALDLFMSLNENDSNQVSILKDINMITNSSIVGPVGDIVLQAGDSVSKILFDGLVSGDTFLTGSASDGRINVYSEGNNIVGFTPNGIQIFIGNLAITSGYMLLDETTDPVAGTNSGKFYVKDVGGISKPFFIGDGQAAVDLSGGGGSQTPILQDVDYDGFDIQDISNVEFRLTTASPAITLAAIWRDANSFNFNAPSTFEIHLDIAGVIEYSFSASTFDLNGNIVIDAGTITPVTDGGNNLGSTSNTWNDVYAQRYRVETGGVTTVNINQIISDAGGMILNTPSGGRFEFEINGSPVAIAIEEDRIQFLKSGRQHRIDANADNIAIIAEGLNDFVALWPYAGATNSAFQVGKTKSFFLTETNVTTPYNLTLLQNNATPAVQRIIGQISAEAENTSSSNVPYARIEFSIADSITAGDESGRMQLIVSTDTGALLPIISVEGDSGGSTGGKLGFFNVAEVNKQSVASDTLANLYTALRNYGLIV